MCLLQKVGAINSRQTPSAVLRVERFSPVQTADTRAHTHTPHRHKRQQEEVVLTEEAKGMFEVMAWESVSRVSSCFAWVAECFSCFQFTSGNMKL